MFTFLYACCTVIVTVLCPKAFNRNHFLFQRLIDFEKRHKAVSDLPCHAMVWSYATLPVA